MKARLQSKEDDFIDLFVPLAQSYLKCPVDFEWSFAYREDTGDIYIEVKAALKNGDSVTVYRAISSWVFHEEWALYARQLAEELGHFGRKLL